MYFCGGRSVKYIRDHDAISGLFLSPYYGGFKGIDG
jgi:hypothetical protein